MSKPERRQSGTRADSAALIARCNIAVARLLARGGVAGASDTQFNSLCDGLICAGTLGAPAAGLSLLDLIEKALDAPAQPAPVIEARSGFFVHPAGTFPLDSDSSGNGIPDEFEEE
jgi:hypothetical protein